MRTMKKKRTPTSKKLALATSIVWIIVVLFSCVCVFFNKDATHILTTVSGSFGIVLSGYFTKSYFENREQYGQVEQYEEFDNQEDLRC